MPFFIVLATFAEFSVISTRRAADVPAMGVAARPGHMNL